MVTADGHCDHEEGAPRPAHLADRVGNLSGAEHVQKHVERCLPQRALADGDVGRAPSHFRLSEQRFVEFRFIG